MRRMDRIQALTAVESTEEKTGVMAPWPPNGGQRSALGQFMLKELWFQSLFLVQISSSNSLP